MACIEEIAFSKGFVDADGFKKLIAAAGKSDYGKYLARVLRDAEAHGPANLAGPHK